MKGEGREMCPSGGKKYWFFERKRDIKEKKASKQASEQASRSPLMSPVFSKTHRDSGWEMKILCI